MTEINVGIIGTGNWGKNHVRNFQNTKNCRLVACCDSDEQKLNAVKAVSPSIKLFTDYHEFLSYADIDAVVIASSAVTHYMMAMDALNCGKHVFVEKPMAMHAKEALDMTNLAREKGLTLMVGHLLEYHPAVEKLKELIDSGDIGDVYYIYSQRVNLGVIRSEENALWSFAPHDISIILYLLNEEPESVSARGASFLQKNLEDVVFVNLKFKSGKMANIQLSWLDPHKIRKTTIVGSKKMVVFDDVEPLEKIKIYDKGVNYKPAIVGYHEIFEIRTGDIWIPKINLKEPLKFEADHFIDCIIGKKTPRSDGMDGLRVTKVLEAAQQSMENNGDVIYIN